MEKVKLSEICNINAGGTPARNKKEYWNDGNIPWCKISDLSDKYIAKVEEYITEEGLNNSSAKLFKKGTILYTIFATIGEVAILNIDSATNQAIAGIEIKDNHIELNYLYYFLKSLKIIMQNKSRGVAQNNINLSILKNTEIWVPEKVVQVKIANKLDKVQEIIDIRKKQIKQLDELIKSQFVEMFGDININDKKWDEDILKNNLSVVGGYAFKSSEFQESGIPILRIGNINTGKFRPKDLMFWKEDETLENYAIYPNDVLISLTGTVGKEDYGNICIIGNDYPKYYLNQRNAKLNLKETLNKEYISYALRVPDIKRRLTGISRGVRQANISNKDIENLKIPIPPIDLQNKFADFVKQIDKQKFEIQKSLEETQKLQDSLMYKYFGG